jgi:hypothetical protein
MCGCWRILLWQQSEHAGQQRLRGGQWGGRGVLTYCWVVFGMCGCWRIALWQGLPKNVSMGARLLE